MNELLEIAVIIVLAKLAGEASERLGQSPILGQIVVGVLLGPSLLGLVAYDNLVELLAQLGIVFLIFLVGLQTRPSEIREVGVESGAIAVGGVVAPFLLGFVAAYAFGFNWTEGIILGASLSATSVAITAGAMMDLGRIRTKVAEMILAAAVIDDVLGLFVLTSVIAILGAGTGNPLNSILFTLVFLGVILPLTWKGVPILVGWLRRMRTEGGLYVIVLGLLFFFAYLAESAGLAAIVGAFLIGMILSQGEESGVTIRNTLPVYYFLAPFFFVSVGLLFDLKVVVDAPLMILVVSIMAIVGKIVGCGIPARLSGLPNSVSLFIGVGMVPRGEVALIIAGFARTFETASGHPLLGAELFSVIAGMSMVTIVISPIILKLLAKRFGKTIDKIK